MKNRKKAASKLHLKIIELKERLKFLKKKQSILPKGDS